MTIELGNELLKHRTSDLATLSSALPKESKKMLGEVSTVIAVENIRNRKLT